MPESTIFTYSDLSVSPLFAQASLEDVKIEERAHGEVFKCEEISVGCSYSDAIKLVKNERLEDVRSATIVLDGLDFRSDRKNRRISVEEITYDFDGHITGDMFGAALLGLPDESQRLVISLHDLKIDDPALFRELSLIADDEEKITTIEDASLSVFYDPDSKEVSVDRFEIDTPVVSMKVSGNLKYSGNSLLNFRPERVLVEVDFEMTPSGISVGQSHESGKYSLKRLKVESNAEFDLKRSGRRSLVLPSGETTLLVEGLTGLFSGRLKQELEMSPLGRMTDIAMDEIAVDKFSTEYSYEDGHLVLSDTELLTPFLKAFLEAEVDIDEADPDNSVIRTAELKVKDISRDVRGALVSLERLTGQSVSVDEKEFVINASGTLGNPVFGSSDQEARPPDEKRVSKVSRKNQQESGVVENEGRTPRDSRDEKPAELETMDEESVEETGVSEPSPAPAIRLVDPPQITTGRRTLLTISGSDLQGATAVTMDGTATIENPPAVNADGTELTVYITVPEGQASGSSVLTIYTPRGMPQTQVAILELPSIESVDPAEFQSGKHTLVTITGRNLRGAMAVTTDRAAVVENPPEVNDDGTGLSVYITLSEGQAAEAFTLTVHTPQGSPTATILLSKQAAITSVEPRKLTIGKRRQITIKGSGLQGASEVTVNRFANVGNPPKVNSDGTQLTFSLIVLDEQKAGSATLTVHTPQGNPEAKLTLVEQPKGALQIDANIRGGECYIDGKLLGTKTVPNYVKLPPGHHRVKIDQPECPPGVFEYDVDVIVNQEVQKFFEFKCEER